MKMTFLFGFRGARPNRRAAFTLVEVLVASTLTTMVVGGILYTHIFGVKMYQITKSKLGVSDQARGAISLLIGEIRSAKSIQIGDGSLSSFTQCADGALQQGRAIQIYATTNSASFVRYYLDGTDAKLKRTTNGTSAIDVVAEYITNNIVFTSEDFRGTNLTSSQNNRVIGLSLQFYQIQYPITVIGPGNFYDFYQLRTKVTRRTVE